MLDTIRSKTIAFEVTYISTKRFCVWMYENRVNTLDQTILCIWTPTTLKDVKTTSRDGENGIKQEKGDKSADKKQY